MTVPRRPIPPARPPGPGRREELGDTRPGAAARSSARRPWLAVGAVGAASLLCLLFAAGAGHASGLQAAAATLARMDASAVEEQFELGIEDLLAGRYELAQQRFEYVLEHDPGRGDAAELLERALAAMLQPTRTPGPTPTPITPTPTLDLSSLDVLFGQAQAAFAAGDWGRVIEASLILRARDSLFRRAEINSLLAQALRARGVQQILARNYELGMYDLALAERFGPLDGGAASWRRSAGFYVYANSFFVVDWIRAAENFASLCAAGLWDSCSKYARAAMEYGHILLASATPCAAATQYQASLLTRSNPELDPTATFAASACQTQIAPTETPTITMTPTFDSTFFLTPTTSETPTLGPTLTASPTLPGGPSSTPSPTRSPTATPTASPTPSVTPG